MHTEGYYKFYDDDGVFKLYAIIPSGERKIKEFKTKKDMWKHYKGHCIL